MNSRRRIDSRELHSEKFDLCRVCLLEPESNRNVTFHPIFDEDDQRTDMVRMIGELLQVKVEKNDVKPKILCNHCHDSIINWYEMKKKAAEAQIVINYIAKKRFGSTESSQSTSNNPGPSFKLNNSAVPTTSSMLPTQSKIHTHSETKQTVQSNFYADCSHQENSSQLPNANQSAYGHESDDCQEVKIPKEVIYVSSDTEDDNNFKMNLSNISIGPYCSICKNHKKLDHDCALYNKEFATCLVPNCNILSRTIRDFDPHYRQHIGMTPQDWICRRCYKENKKTERDSDGQHICSGVNTFKCYKCGLILNSMGAFAYHKLKKHNGRLINSAGNYICFYCEKSSPDMKIIEEHINQHHPDTEHFQNNPVKCEMQQEEPKVPETSVLTNDNDKNVTKKRTNLSQNNGNKIEYSHQYLFFTCLKPSCDLIFQYFPNFKFHHREHFNTGKKTMCWQCCSPFDSVADLRIHQVKGNCRTPGMFSCFKCSETFDNIERLSIHKYIAHNGKLVIQKKGQKTIFCPSCKLPTYVNGFKNHLIKCHLNKSNNSTTNKTVPNLTIKSKASCKCGFCGKVCLTRAALSSHIKVHNQTKTMNMRTNKEVNSTQFRLSQNNFNNESVIEVSSTTNTSYNNSQRFVKYEQFPFVNGVYSCIQCPRKFNTKMGLAKHWPFCKPQKKVYTSPKNVQNILPKNYYCTDCNEYFTRPGFGTHFRNIHGKKLALKKYKRYPCTKCSRKFLYKEALSMHYQHEHDELKTTVPNATSADVNPNMLPVVANTMSLATGYTNNVSEEKIESNGNGSRQIKEEFNNTTSESVVNQWYSNESPENCNNVPDVLFGTKISEEINSDNSNVDMGDILPSEMLSVELNDNETVAEQLDNESTMEIDVTNLSAKNNETKESIEANGNTENCTDEVITASNDEFYVNIVKKEFTQNCFKGMTEVNPVKNTHQIVNEPNMVDQEQNLMGVENINQIVNEPNMVDQEQNLMGVENINQIVNEPNMVDQEQNLVVENIGTNELIDDLISDVNSTGSIL